MPTFILTMTALALLGDIALTLLAWHHGPWYFTAHAALFLAHLLLAIAHRFSG